MPLRSAVLAQRVASRYLRNAGTDVARTILDQMGGQRRIMMMTGAKNFMSFPEEGKIYGKGLGGISFQFPQPGAGKPNYVSITLDPSDTYIMEFGYATSRRPSRILKSFDDVYADQLREIFERTTGLYLSL